MMKKSFKIAFGGILSAVSVIVLLLGNIPMAEYIGPTFAGLMLFWAVVELGSVSSLGIYVAVSILSFFLSSNKEPVLLYILFFGYFPVLRYVLLKYVRVRLIRIIIKAAVFNGAMAAAYALLVFVFGMPLSELQGLGKYSLYILLAGANVLLIVFDICLGRVELVYKLKWQKRVHKAFGIKKDN